MFGAELVAKSAHGNRSSWTGKAGGTAAWRGLRGVSVSVSPLPSLTHTPAHTYSIYPHIHTPSLSLVQQQHPGNRLLLIGDSIRVFALTQCVLHNYILISSPRKRILAWERRRGSVWNGVGEAE